MVKVVEEDDEEEGVCTIATMSACVRGHTTASTVR